MSTLNASENALRAEHLKLGARFCEAPAGTQWTHDYAGVPGEAAREALRDGAVIADMSGSMLALVNGSSSEQFIEATCAARRLKVGQAGFSATLFGDGSVAALPLVARSGNGEYLLWDMTVRADSLYAWLSYVQAIESDGFAPYADTKVGEEETEKVVPLLVWGSRARAILADYLTGDTSLPEAGEVFDCSLDGRIPALVIGLNLANTPALLVLVPTMHARTLWRSLLSFQDLLPIGAQQAHDMLLDALSWMGELGRSTDKTFIAKHDLSRYFLIRSDGGYIGERGLSLL